MKKFLSIILILILAASVLILPTHADDTDDALIVTVNGANPTRIAVGNEFIIRVGLCASDKKLINGQAKMTYDESVVSFVPALGEEEDVESYCFPMTIYNAGLVLNAEWDGLIYYNFSRITGVSVFNNTDKLFAKFRFKATAAGETDITHIIEYMKDVDDRVIYYGCEPSPELKPYTAITLEPSYGCIGDADGDFNVTVMDVTAMQRAAAGVDFAYDPEIADLNSDGSVSLKDALAVCRYLADIATPYPIGKRLFLSE